MLSFLFGLVIGAVFSPFWMMLYTTYLKPAFIKLVDKVKSKAVSAEGPNGPPKV